MANLEIGPDVENEEEEEKEKLERRLRNKQEYILRLEQRVIQFIKNNNPEHHIRYAVWLFARYLAYRSNIELKYVYKHILPIAEQFANNINNDEAYQELLKYFDTLEIYQNRNRYYIRIKTQTVEIGPVEQKLNESRINEYMRFALRYIEENKTVSFTQLKHYLISNKMFIEENVLIQELKKLENNLIRIQYDIEENKPNLIEWEA